MATAETLEAEARERPRMTIVAIAAALLTLAAPIIGLVALQDAPENLIAETLYRDDHLGVIAASAACSALGLITITAVLDFLLRATRARRPELPWQLRPLLWLGGAGLAILLVVFQVVAAVKLNHFATEGSQTYEEAREANSYGAAAYIGILAQFAFAGAFVTIAVSAMRVGLLSRFLGYLGVISAVLFVIPLVPIPIVQVYWLGALALLFLGRSPSGTPPAWQSGEAMPWPSAAEMREQRVREAEVRRGGDDTTAAGDPTPPDGYDEMPGVPGSVTKRKKRKRR